MNDAKRIAKLCIQINIPSVQKINGRVQIEDSLHCYWRRKGRTPNRAVFFVLWWNYSWYGAFQFSWSIGLYMVFQWYHTMHTSLIAFGSLCYWPTLNPIQPILRTYISRCKMSMYCNLPQYAHKYEMCIKPWASFQTIFVCSQIVEPSNKWVTGLISLSD